MPILTLTTDFGTKSFDVAALKGKLMCATSDLTIIDISHDIAIFDKMNAAYALKNASLNFPPKTIHFTNINLKEGQNRMLIVSRDSQFYICPDNGFICMMFPQEDFKAYVLNGLEKDFSYNEVNNKLCEIISSDELDLTRLGTLTNSYMKATLMRAAIMPDIIRASVIHVDIYGNAIVNVSKGEFYRFIENGPFTITARGYRAHKISKHYSEVEQGEIVCLFNDADLLEVAISNHKATQLLGLEYGTLILIERM